MKSERIETPKEKEVRKYPYLGRFVNKENTSDFIVLFTSYKEGMIIEVTIATTFTKPVGYSSYNWDEKLFTIYKGKVVISNN